MRAVGRDAKGDATAGARHPRPWRRTGGMAPPLALLAVLAATGAPAGDRLEITFLDSVRIAERKAGFDEPSGLALAADGSHLWSVSDDTSRVFRLGFDGALLPGAIDLPFAGLEGIALAPESGMLLAVREDSDEILVIDPAGKAPLQRRPLSAIEGYQALAMLFEGSGRNKGLEGIAVHAGTGNVFVLKEAEPRLIVEIAPGLDRILGHRLLNGPAGFPESLGRDGGLDVSGLAHDPVRDLFWIVSDTGRRLFLYDHRLGRATSVELRATWGGKARSVGHAEGIALDQAGDRLLVVTDDGKSSRLLSFGVVEAGTGEPARP